VNDQNLIKPKRDQTAEQRKAAASKAGKAAAKKRREKKQMQEIAKIVLHMPFEGTDAQLDDLEGLSFEDYPDRKLTVSEISILKVAKKAMRGDIAAIQFLRDTAGEKPVEQIEVSADIGAACDEIGKLIEAKRDADKG
jgi:hypothetical protein